MLVNPRLAAQLQRKTEELFYSDLAVLLIDVPTGAYDEYNQPVMTENEIPIECSFTDNPAQEQWIGYADIQLLAAEIRFAAPTPGKGDRIKLTGRFGGIVAPIDEYEIIGIRDRGTFGYVCALKKVSI